MKFYDYEWHDAILKGLNINRSNPGYNDTISMDIEWPDDTSSMVLFEDVYKAIIDMNFGIKGADVIIEVSLASGNDEDLLEVKKAWKDAHIGNVNCYVFQTTTLGSKIKIIAKSFKVLKPDK